MKKLFTLIVLGLSLTSFSQTIAKSYNTALEVTNSVVETKEEIIRIPSIISVNDTTIEFNLYNGEQLIKGEIVEFDELREYYEFVINVKEVNNEKLDIYYLMYENIDTGVITLYVSDTFRVTLLNL